LSDIKVIHRDLACRNILVGDNKCLKITDFGMSRVVTEDDPVYNKTTSGHLPYRWMALECLQKMNFTMETDVWSFGVTMWEIASLGRKASKPLVTSKKYNFLEENTHSCKFTN